MRKINRYKLISIGERDTMHMVPERHTQVSQTFRCQTEWELEVGITTVNIQVAFFFFSCLIWSFWFVSLLLFTFSETCLSLYGKFNWHISIRIDFYVSRSQLFRREEKWSSSLCTPRTDSAEKHQVLFIHSLTTSVFASDYQSWTSPHHWGQDF